MKSVKILSAALMLALAAACGSPKFDNVKDAPKEAKALLPSQSEIDSVSYLVGVNFGSFIKGNNFGDLNFSQMKKGIIDFLKAEGNPRDSAFVSQFKIDPTTMNELFNAYIGKRNDFRLAANAAKETKFLEDNKKNAEVIETESGLQYIVLEEGGELKPGPKDTVLVRYKGTLTDGTVFDQSRGDEPVSMLLSRVIPGWTEGLQLIGEGGKIRLFVPSALGYGERGQGGVIEPNSTLIFDVDLDSVKPFVEKEK